MGQREIEQLHKQREAETLVDEKQQQIDKERADRSADKRDQYKIAIAAAVISGISGGLFGALFAWLFSRVG